MKISKLAVFALVLSTLTISCKDDDGIDEDIILGDYSSGILVSGEGSGAGTGSVTFIPEDLSAPQHLIYKTVNDGELGTFLQSISFSDTEAYISVDNQHTITVVDRFTFEETGKINSGLNHPRYFAVVGEKGYSTNWGETSIDTDDYIAVVDLTSNTVTSTIPVALGPERIIENDNKLYVSHKGAWGTNNIISVIDISTQAVTEITVGDKPDELLFDLSGDLFVLSEGKVEYDANWNITGHTLASISKINVTTNTVTSKIEFVEGEHPSLLERVGDDLYYYLNSSVYTLKTSATALPTTSYIETGSINGMAFNDTNFFTVVANYTALSELNVYPLTSKELSNTLKVSIGASKIYFNE